MIFILEKCTHTGHSGKIYYYDYHLRYIMMKHFILVIDFRAFMSFFEFEIFCVKTKLGIPILGRKITKPFLESINRSATPISH